MRSEKLRQMNTLASFLLLSCVAASSLAVECKVLDPDLAQGIYSGGCKEGWADGYGEVSGVSSYRGDFLAGKKHGRGIKVMPNGDRYSGEFSQDYREGKGVYVWGGSTPWAGDRYQGEYHRDLRHGWGIFQWGSGDRYEGQWQDDLRMGLSPMELRRAQAAAAAVQSLKLGLSVCAEAQLGLVSRQPIRGQVARIEGETAEIQIIEVEGGVASYSGKQLKAGESIMDAAVHWQPCGNGSK